MFKEKQHLEVVWVSTQPTRSVSSRQNDTEEAEVMKEKSNEDYYRRSIVR